MVEARLPVRMGVGPRFHVRVDTQMCLLQVLSEILLRPRWPHEMNIRKAKDEDAGQIVRIFHETIHKVNIEDYTAEQIDAWSPRLADAREWSINRLHTRNTYVADDGGMVTGFGELVSDGHIDCLYCHYQYQRQGVGSVILRRIEEEAVASGLPRLFTEASVTARPFFEAHGFTVVKEQGVIRRGVELTTFAMEKQLEANNRLEHIC
jgi:putative acetyltransferase